LRYLILAQRREDAEKRKDILKITTINFI